MTSDDSNADRQDDPLRQGRSREDRSRQDPPPQDPLRRDTLRGEAAAWVARLTSGEATDADALQVRAWRRRSPDHEDAFRTASAAWRASAPAARLAVRAPVHDSAHEAPPVDARRRRFLVGAAAAASGAAAAGFAGASLGLLPTLSDLMSDYATAVGVQRQFSLADGSVLDLDAGSALNARFTADARRLQLVEGAALFDVAPDARTFEVEAGAGTVIAQDGRFSLSRGADATRVACIKGRLDLVCGGTTLHLQAGNRASFAADGRVSAVEPADPASAAAWRRGLLLIEDRPLDAVAADLNRYRTGRVIVAGPAGARRVSAAFHLDRIAEAVPQLAASLGLRSIALPGGIVILS